MSGMSPISFSFIAAGAARYGRASLVRFTPSQVNAEMPSWDGHGAPIQTAELSVPITERTYWENRYVLTELDLRKANGETLTINDAIVTVSQQKQIVKTALVGLPGTIKEFISIGDYDISLAIGIVAVDANNQIIDEYPEDGIVRVLEFLGENNSIEVNSAFLSLFGIKRIVVTSFSVQQQTHSNRQTIEVKALSDDDYTIKSTEF